MAAKDLIETITFLDDFRREKRLSAPTKPGGFRLTVPDAASSGT
jgi:hypothetical protein